MTTAYDELMAFTRETEVNFLVFICKRRNNLFSLSLIDAQILTLFSCGNTLRILN